MYVGGGLGKRSFRGEREESGDGFEGCSSGGSHGS